MKTGVVMLSAMGEDINLTTNPVKAAGWYGPTQALHTVAFRTLNFRGMLYIEGTLVVAPAETDWFPILLDGADHLVFPRTLFPQPAGPANPGWFGESVTLGYSFTCNCLWLRARVVRSNIIPPFSTQEQVSLYGSIDSILLAF